MLFEKKLFTGAKLVLPDRVLEASLATRAGVIEGILQPGVKLPGYEEIDVTGKILFPGLVDPHVHLSLIHISAAASRRHAGADGGGHDARDAEPPARQADVDLF